MFPSSSTLYVNKNNIVEARKAVTSRPFLTDAWLVIVSLDGITEDIVTTFSGSGKDAVIYVARTKEFALEVNVLLTKLRLEYGVVDNINPSKDEVHDYIIENLNVDMEMAVYIGRRYRYYVPKIVEAVDVLTGVPKVTKESVRKYTDRFSELSYNALFDFILGISTDVSFAKVTRLVSSYRYGVSYLVEFVVDRLSLYMKIYDKVLSGFLSLENMIEYHQKHKADLKVSDYTLKKAIETTQLVSYDKLYLLYNLYKKELQSKPTPVSFMRLLSLSNNGEVK